MAERWFRKRRMGNKCDGLNFVDSFAERPVITLGQEVVSSDRFCFRLPWRWDTMGPFTPIPTVSYDWQRNPKMSRHSTVFETRVRGLRVLVLACTVALSACAAKYAVVRESLFRSEESKQDRIVLPLDDKSAKALVGFLAAGIRRDVDGSSANRNPTDDRVYGTLLQALRSSENLEVDLSKSGRHFCDIAVKLCGHTELFRGRPATFDVIDAREHQPAVPYPIAVSDGRFWWVFYHHQDKDGRDTLQKLLVTRMAGRKVVSDEPPR